jgi:hypothetical protein
MRVTSVQKKINIQIPKLDVFIHKCYVECARKIYKNVYLYELDVGPLQIQKHNRELEIIVQECILNVVRESIPVENLLAAYLDETTEEVETTVSTVENVPIHGGSSSKQGIQVIEEVQEAQVPIVQEQIAMKIQEPMIEPTSPSITFNDVPNIVTIPNTVEETNARMGEPSTEDNNNVSSGDLVIGDSVSLSINDLFSSSDISSSDISSSDNKEDEIQILS